jgi:tryptophanyl-tRNA synthetase
MKRLVSGIKPTGDIHIGNYFGAMQQMLSFQNEYECFLFVADLHAFNQIQDAEQMRKGIVEIAKAYLAIGIDPTKVTLFQESQVSSHSELTILLNSLTSLGLLERAHAVKDARAKNKPINAGLLEYPVLMASDILLYHADVVPVGEDQQQHLEMTREMAERFNHLFGDYMTLPQGVHGDVGTIKGTDGQKMSKSYNNVIGLFESPEAVTQKVMRITTDSKAPNESKDPEIDTLFAFHKLFSKDELPELAERYRKGDIGYKESKDILAKNMNIFLDPIRTKKAELDTKEDYVLDILKEGATKARPIASATLAEVQRRIGLELTV